jgi:hypothetical protein
VLTYFLTKAEGLALMIVTLEVEAG